MSNQATIRVGKAKIKISVEGCVDCGTCHAPGWSLERSVIAMIGKSKASIAVSICGECSKRRDELTTYNATLQG